MRQKNVTPEMELKALKDALKQADGPCPVALHALGQGAVNHSWILSRVLKGQIEAEIERREKNE